MSDDPDAAYRCPRCGATSALLMPEPSTRASEVTVKCLQCAHVVRLPRSRLAGAGGPLDSNRSLE
jgi:hypothetical protein